MTKNDLQVKPYR